MSRKHLKVFFFNLIISFQTSKIYALYMLNKQITDILLLGINIKMLLRQIVEKIHTCIYISHTGNRKRRGVLTHRINNSIS